MQTLHEILYSSYGDDWQKIYFDVASQGFVVAHRLHGKDELPINSHISIRLAKLFGERIELLPRLYGVGVKSADATRNGEVWEFKITNGTTTSVQLRIREGSHQSPRILLALPDVFDESDVLKGLMSAVNVDKNGRIELVHFLLPNGKLVELTRQMIQRRDFQTFFDALK